MIMASARAREARAGPTMTRTLVSLLLLGCASGCPEAARDDLRQAAAAIKDNDLDRAGKKLGGAAAKTSEVVETKVDQVAERAVDAAETARAMADPDRVGREFADAISCKGTRCSMKRAQYDELMGNPMVLASELSMSPEQSGGKTRWRIGEVRVGGACERLGLQAGDLVLRINGRTLGKTILDELPSAKKVVIELERKGKRIRREIRPK
jgi:type II secretory pathway component PulC